MKMKLMTMAVIAGAFASVAMAGSANANLSVSASIADNCLITTTSVSFGAYDAISANASTALNGTGAVKVTCTKNAAATVKLGQGANAGGSSTDAAPVRQMSDGSSNVMSYQLYSDSGRTSVWNNDTGVSHTGTGSEVTLTVYGKVPAGQNTLPAGSYNDTVQATVTF